MVRIKAFPVNPLGENTVLLWKEGGRACVVIDPGMLRGRETTVVMDFLSAEGLSPAAILLTPGHFDHTCGVAALLGNGPLPVYMHPADLPLARLGVALNPGLANAAGTLFGTEEERERWLSGIRPAAETAPIEAAGMTFRVIETPGHSPGSVCYYLEDEHLLFAGDTLFAGSIGRSDLPGGDYDDLIRSIMDKLMGLPGETDVICGHGPATSVGREAMTNPFLVPFNEPEPQWEDGDPLPLEGI